jgi:hypothetical protein
VGHRDDVVAQAEREKHLGGGGNEAGDTHLDPNMALSELPRLG